MNNKPVKIQVPKLTVDAELLGELRELFARAEDQKERYDFTWNGKAKAYFEAATPTTKTLRPQPEESYIYADDNYTEKVNTFNDSENLFITGDNLEALKLLQESYLNKIDMIYIDPPYNTGKDFVYRDNFKQTQKEADLAEGNVDDEGNRLVKNDKSSGRYHSDWLSMMYPRLKLARNLLSDTGVIFVSIDDNEQANLKLLMDEVFGEDNFISQFTRVTKKGGKSSESTAKNHDFIFLYSKNVSEVQLQGVKHIDSGYKFKDSHFDERGFYKLNQTLDYDSLGWVKTLDYPIDIDNLIFYAGGSKERYNQRQNGQHGRADWGWRWSKELLEFGLKNDFIEVRYGGARPRIYTKTYANVKIEKIGSEYKIVKFDRTKPLSTLEFTNNLYSNDNAKKQFDELMETGVFDYTKPTSLIEKMISLIPKKELLILDFFAGSGTTGHAVIAANKKDKVSRRFILVQIDQKTDAGSASNNFGYTTIEQISRERIRRAAEKLGDTSGFRALKVDETGTKSNIFKTVNDTNQDQLLNLVDNQVDSQTDFDLLYAVLVDGALEYNRKISNLLITGVDVIAYDYFGKLSGVLAYFGDQLSNDLTREIAKKKPLIAVFKESTFEKSAQKVNVLEQFRILSPDTKVKVI